MIIVCRFAVSRLFAQKNVNSINCRELQTREIRRSTEMAGVESLWALRSEHEEQTSTKTSDILFSLITTQQASIVPQRVRLIALE